MGRSRNSNIPCFFGITWLQFYLFCCSSAEPKFIVRMNDSQIPENAGIRALTHTAAAEFGHGSKVVRINSFTKPRQHGGLIWARAIEPDWFNAYFWIWSGDVQYGCWGIRNAEVDSLMVRARSPALASVSSLLLSISQVTSAHFLICRYTTYHGILLIRPVVLFVLLDRGWGPMKLMRYQSILPSPFGDVYDRLFTFSMIHRSLFSLVSPVFCI